MNVEILVYGVPFGAQEWKEDDKEYFATFYNDMCSDKVKYLIQTRKSNGILYCYYNYLVYDNVVDYQGRDGSFFGMTFRIDAYCKDIVNMYRILDYVYHTYVLGKILKTSGTKLKYAISDFSSVDRQLKNMEELMIQMIQNTFSEDDFESLNGFHLGDGSCAKYNLYDFSQDKIRNIVRSSGRVAISPYYLNSRETAIQQQCQTQVQQMQQQCDEQIQTTQQKCDARLDENNRAYENRISSLENALSSVKNDRTQLQNKISSQSVEIQRLQSEKTKLQKVIERNGKTKEISQLVERISKPLNRLALLCGDVVPAKKVTYIEAQPTPRRVNVEQEEAKEIKRPSRSIVKSLVPLINLLLLVVLILLVLIFHIGEDNKGNVDVGRLHEQIESLQKEKENLQNLLDSQVTEDTNDQNTDLQEDFDINTVKIDIKSYSGRGDLTVGRKYTVVAENGTNDGIWDVSGCEKEETNLPNYILITPTEPSVTIIYRVGNKQIERNLTAK